MRHPLLTFAVLCGLLAPLTLRAPVARAADAAAATATEASASTPSARVIVKFKADSTVLRKQVLASASGESLSAAQLATQAAAMHTARAEALGSRLGLALVAGHGVADRTQVMKAAGMSSQQLAARLAQENDIEYAVPDERRKAYTAPNDPLYLTGPAITGSGSTQAGGPAAGQWYLRPNDSTVKSSIDVESAWAITPGTAGIVVAVVDTGLRFDHADLQGGNVLPGYDFISDAFVGNDGDGRDADASDPGDFVTAADVASASGKAIGCTSSDVENSSWHGTQTLGLIGAATNNGVGIASVGRGNVRVMPVRVLGKCGGYDSDIIAGMRWAAGLAVAGVPANTTPARVINLSLGGSGTCSSAYIQAVADINATGAVVVASAGNSEGHAVSTPANCTGVVAVAGLRHVGTKVGFSDLGPEITLAAPAGNCVNTAANTACLYPIPTTLNSGTSTPIANSAGGSVYSDAFDASLGTSFSAPLVSGTVALMLSAQPALTPAQVKAALQSSARVFPTSGGDNGDGTVVATCQAPNASVNQDQCYCTTSTCGAGMLDAGAAVKAGLALVVTSASISSSPSAPTAGQLLTLSATISGLASTRSIASYAWTISNGGGIVSGFASSATAASTTVTPSAAGTFSVALTVTDSAGTVFTATQTISVAAAVVAPPTTTQPPTAIITFAPAAPVAGGTVQLSSSSSSAVSGRTLSSYQWSITQGSAIASLTSGTTASTATLSARASGNVTVSLTVTDSAGAQTTSSTSIFISAAPPTVSIALTSGAAVVGSNMTFDGSGSTVSSGNTIRSYQWTISNGTGTASLNGATNGTSVTVLPTAAGSFTLTLTVIDSAGLSSSGSIAETVAASASASPTGVITVTPAAPVAGSTVQLDATASSAATGRTITAYQWAISQGADFAAFSSGTSARTATISTHGSGMLVVSLLVTDSAGAQTTTTANILVSVTPPVVNIRQTSSGAVVGTPISLDGSGSTASAGHSIKSYQWSISSGSGIAAISGASTNASVNILPSATGSFTATLTVTDDAGLSSSASQSIDVSAAPVTTTPTSSTGGGGGALGLHWLALLALAVVAAARSTRAKVG